MRELPCVFFYLFIIIFEAWGSFPYYFIIILVIKVFSFTAPSEEGLIVDT